jgi:alpha-beta hydrolase superfamily lysophospholipase
MIGRRALLAAGLATPLSAQAQTFKARELRFAGAGGIELAGTLLLPAVGDKQQVPGVVVIAGSGPTDRDGNNPLIPRQIDLLKQIAERLAGAGIASLRYDKRGIGGSTKSPGALAEQELFFSWENFIGDVVLAHAELIEHSEVKPYATALLGHSEGGLFAIATAQASIARPPYALVLASTPGRPLQAILHEQLTRRAPQFVEPAERIMAEISKTGHAPHDIPRELSNVFPAYIGPFLKGELAFDPAKMLADLKQPCLLIHGGADRQIVPMAEIQPLIDALAKRAVPGEVLVAPEVSHNLKPVSGSNDPGFAGPLAPAVADKLTSWLGQTLGA